MEIQLLMLIVFFSASRTEAQNFPFDNTLVEDPLQPIWNRLESLTNDITSMVSSRIEANNQIIINKLTEKFQGLSSQQESNSNTPSSDSFNDSLNNLKTWMTSNINDQIKTHMDSQVSKLEQHITVKMSALEDKLIEHINTKFDSLVITSSNANNSTPPNEASPAPAAIIPGSHAAMDQLSSQLISFKNIASTKFGEITGMMTASSSTLDVVNTHVLKISEKIDQIEEATMQDGTATCAVLVDKVHEILANAGSSPAGGISPVSVNESSGSASPYLLRDCSDHHWLHPEAPSGVYETYPTMDRKSPVSVYCDMGEESKDNGGWTVILRRQLPEQSQFEAVNFNRTLKAYSRGFGDPGEGEWWYGLDSLHALTYRQPYEIDFLMKDIEEGYFKATYNTFRVEDEAQNYRLIVDGFSGNITRDAIGTTHNGRPFSTIDNDVDGWEAGSCAASNGGGWWFNACHYATLTAPLPVDEDRDTKTIRWVKDPDGWYVFDDVTVKIRPANYGKRFDSHQYN